MPATAKVAAGLVWSNEKGENSAELMAATARFDPQGRLVALDDAPGGKVLIEKGTPTDTGASDALAWGRWIGGKSKVHDNSGPGNGIGNGNLATLHYVTALSTPAGPTSGVFTSFASTAPTVQSNGDLVATGAVNSAGGTFTAALLLHTKGGANYVLTVPVAGQTFKLTGTATQTSISTFSGISTITSTGTGCQGGCTGSLGNNVSVIGQLAGAQGTSAGVLYGFDSRLGNVSGVIVFRR